MMTRKDQGRKKQIPYGNDKQENNNDSEGGRTVDVLPIA
jgi:hypothetical protein